jgi:hypothetical protein
MRKTAGLQMLAFSSIRITCGICGDFDGLSFRLNADLADSTGVGSGQQTFCVFK